MSNSDRHDKNREPNIIGLLGRRRRGRDEARRAAPGLKERTPIANLHLTLLQKVGAERDKFGDSTGTISEV